MLLVGQATQESLKLRTTGSCGKSKRKPKAVVKARGTGERMENESRLNKRKQEQNAHHRTLRTEPEHSCGEKVDRTIAATEETTGDGTGQPEG